MISEDKYLERIVAGIHAVTTTGAEIVWNEVINGRQFDVVVRFRVGTLRYLVLVEVKNRTRRASANDMDAFVLKARDQNANKAVFVTAAGFQTGAIAVAQRHGVDLFTVTLDESDLRLSAEGTFIVIQEGATPELVSPEISIGEPILVAQIRALTLFYTDGRRFNLPDEQSQMTYYAVKTCLKNGKRLVDLIEENLPASIDLGEERTIHIPLKRPQLVQPPDEYFFPAGKLASIEYTVEGSQSRPIEGTARIEPGAFQPSVVYTNVVTGEASRYALDQLPLGTTTASVGGFYFIAHPIRYYYCAGIEDDIVRWHLIESFQNADLITGTYTQKIKYSPHYIPVSDKRILSRLRKRLVDYTRRSLQHN